MRAARRSPALAGVLALAVSSGCGGGSSRDPAPSRTHSVAELEGFVLRRDEAPLVTEYVDDASGSLDLDELWPSSCCPAQQEVFADAAFRGAAGALFERPGHSGDPIDTRPGYEVLSSQVALFVTEAGASAAMEEWIDYHAAPELDPLLARGLGQEAAAFVGSPNAPGETVVLFYWRIGGLVLHLRATGGGIRVTEVRAMADRMDARAS